MASGNPKPNFYAAEPLTASLLDPYEGIFHGPNQETSKNLARMGLVTPTAAFVGAYNLLDYLLFYPFVDGDDTAAQAMDNTIPLPRYEDGDGVMVMAVAVAPTTGSGVFTFDYIDHAGNPRTSPAQSCSTTAANIATIATSQQAVAGMPGGPFLALASGSRGVRSITSVTYSVPNGGLTALVLVRPLFKMMLQEINTMSEIECVTMKTVPLPVLNGAYLNLIVNVAGSIAAGTLIGYCDFYWSE